MITLTTTIEAQKDGSIIVAVTSRGRPQANEANVKAAVMEATKEAMLKADETKRTTIIEGDQDYAARVWQEMRNPL